MAEQPLLWLSFGGFAALTLLSAFGLVISRRLVQAAFSLFATLFGVAGLFVFAQASFLAVSQVILYVGGILLMIIFGIMLTRRKLGDEAKTDLHQVFPGLLLSGLVGVGLFLLVGAVDWELLLQERATQLPAEVSSVQILGKQFLTTYLLPFELLSLLLLVILLGSVYMANTVQD
ncbi:MAG: NADH-quinone oxidoreductase subunit J [Bacteroidota bacterium]